MEKQTRTIEIDAQVYAEIQTLARPLEDTANSVLRRVFGLDEGAAVDGFKSAPVTHPKPPRRAAFGELLSEREYEIPILQSIEEMGGSAVASRVVDAVGEKVSEQLTPLDLERVPSGVGIRWRGRVAFTRLRMVERGLIKADSPRGRWEITDEGRRHLREAVTRG